MDLLFEWVKAFFSDIQINYIIDILIIATVFYQLLGLIKETRAEQLIKGFLVIIVVSRIAEWGKLYAISFILQSTFTVGVIALVIIFQPELRKALEHVGRTQWLKGIRKNANEELEEGIFAIVEAVSTMSRKKIGALIVMERYIGINDISETGTKLDASISPELIMNVFFPKSPLHDGAMVIKNNRIIAAGCLLPLSSNKFLSKELGTRHRAAMGMTESSDAFIIVVSEETGAISMALEGKLHRFLDPSTLRDQLLKVIANKEMSDEKH